mmetsp:Transcript_19160/g.22147  ORF Transcript_19160/g.22147 Transcript_19160/m.22147 type:complete len:265 (+) Transcript_19160:115-909(+)
MRSLLYRIMNGWHEDDDKDSYDHRSSHPRSPSVYQRTEYILGQVLGSCTNLQQFFESYSPRSSNRDSFESRSRSTVTTEDSSSHSRSSYKKIKKARSVEYHRMSERQTNNRRHRSVSKNYGRSGSRTMRMSFSPTKVPVREPTEIEVVTYDDDVSAISARTLNEIYSNEMELKRVDRQQHSGLYRDHDRFNGSDEQSNISYKSSVDTSEFESVWNAKGNVVCSKSDRRYTDNSQLTAGTIRRYNQWEMQPIKEGDSLLHEEQEI